MTTADAPSSPPSPLPPLAPSSLLPTQPPTSWSPTVHHPLRHPNPGSTSPPRLPAAAARGARRGTLFDVTGSLVVTAGHAIFGAPALRCDTFVLLVRMQVPWWSGQHRSPLRRHRCCEDELSGPTFATEENDRKWHFFCVMARTFPTPRRYGFLGAMVDAPSSFSAPRSAGRLTRGCARWRSRVPTVHNLRRLRRATVLPNRNGCGSELVRLKAHAAAFDNRTPERG